MFDLAPIEGLYRGGPEASDARVVANAGEILADLLAALQAIPVGAEPVGTMLPGDGVFIGDLDCVARWIGARIEDQCRAVAHLAR